MKTDFGWWITGIIDGEGHLGASLGKNGSMNVVLSIQVSEEDKEILEKVKDYLGCGFINFSSRAGDRARGRKVTDEFIWRIREAKVIYEKVLPHFKEYPLQSPKKIREFLVWKEAIEIALRNWHKIKGRESDKFIKLCQELRSFKHRGREPR